MHFNMLLGYNNKPEKGRKLNEKHCIFKRRKLENRETALSNGQLETGENWSSG